MNSNRNRWPDGRVIWVVIGALFSLATAFGAEIVVTNPGDQPIAGQTSLREAIAASAPNDVITVAVDQPIMLTEGELVIDHNLELRRPEWARRTSGSLNPASFGLFTISSGTVAFSHLTLRNGYVNDYVIVTSPATRMPKGAASLTRPR